MKIPEKVSTKIVTVSVFLSLLGPLAAMAAGPAPVDLRSAGSFAVLSQSGISTTGASSITGDIGVSPIAASAITGFGLILDSSNAFSTTSLVTGKVYATDYAVPTPAKMTAAVSDMQAAYSDAAGRTLPTATELGAGNIGGLTLAPGLYKWGTGVTIPTDVTLAGSANDVWIFQVGQTLNLSSGAKVVLSGGAQAGNVYWVVAGQTTIGTTAAMSGTILDQTAIVLNTGATLNGRALAQTAVTLNASSVTLPAMTVVTPTPAPVATPAPTSTSSSSSSSSGSSSYSNGGSSGGGGGTTYIVVTPVAPIYPAQTSMVAPNGGVIAGTQMNAPQVATHVTLTTKPQTAAMLRKTRLACEVAAWHARVVARVAAWSAYRSARAFAWKAYLASVKVARTEAMPMQKASLNSDWKVLLAARVSALSTLTATRKTVANAYRSDLAACKAGK